MGHAGDQVRRFSHRDGHVNGQNAATGPLSVCGGGGRRREEGGRGGVGVQSGWSGSQGWMDGMKGGGSRRPTTNSQLLQELHRKTAPHRTEVRLSRTAIHPGCAHFSGRWRGVEGFEG